MNSRSEAQAARKLMQQRWYQWNQQIRHHFLEPKHRQCAFYFIECSGATPSLSPAERFTRGFDARDTSTPPDSVEGFYESIVKSTSRGSYHAAGGHFLRVFKDFDQACRWAVRTRHSQRLWVINGKDMDSILIYTGNLPHGDNSPVPVSEHLVVHWIPSKVLVAFYNLMGDTGLLESAVTREDHQLEITSTRKPSSTTRLSSSAPEDSQTLFTPGPAFSSRSFSSSDKTLCSSGAAPRDLHAAAVNEHNNRGLITPGAESETGELETIVEPLARIQNPEPSVMRPLLFEEQNGTYEVRQILTSRTVTVNKEIKGRKRRRVNVIEYLVDWELDPSGNSWKPDWVKAGDVGHQHKKDWKIKEAAWKGMYHTGAPKGFEAIVFDEEYHIFEDGTIGQGYLVIWRDGMPLKWMKFIEIDKAKRKEYAEKNRIWTAMAKKWEEDVIKKL